MASNPSELRRMTDGEIHTAIDEAKAELFNLRFQWESGQLEDYTRIRVLKKNIARYLTILRERELAAQVVQQEDSNAE
ncbi:MAG: 50S ribosomal protein L29 [Chloroflexi bacterium]|jgi:large subunit ribosomal protein L29|nr:50S ribosomal protein L29 [Chloroflexota bacterium]